MAGELQLDTFQLIEYRLCFECHDMPTTLDDAGIFCRMVARFIKKQ
jgi:hypothetical protein